MLIRRLSISVQRSSVNCTISQNTVSLSTGYFALLLKLQILRLDILRLDASACDWIHSNSWFKEALDWMSCCLRLVVMSTGYTIVMKLATGSCDWEHCDVLSMQMDSYLVIYRTTLVRTFQVSTRSVLGKWVYLVTLVMSLFDLQDVCIAIGSLATLDLPMVVDLIGIYVLKGTYCTLTMTNWFLQALSVIPRGSWGDVARRFTMIRWATSTLDKSATHLSSPLGHHAPPVVVDLIGESTAAYSLKCRFPRETGRSQAPRRQQGGRRARRPITRAIECATPCALAAHGGRPWPAAARTSLRAGRAWRPRAGRRLRAWTCDGRGGRQPAVRRDWRNLLRHIRAHRAPCAACAAC
ncbi:hypothetical protein F511_30262 [Dorcoceras hygrometricum]|uniref:Uncharacterized protein n=1 Tax=Dorcoceras hygrometricum TaxID=472368 RepID=A0A2Z7BMS4_9LAMI|nr:hypothetical protein F511_30262 [Dorcoceras hygrometricum]